MKFSQLLKKMLDEVEKNIKPEDEEDHPCLSITTTNQAEKICLLKDAFFATYRQLAEISSWWGDIFSLNINFEKQKAEPNLRGLFVGVLILIRRLGVEAEDIVALLDKRLEEKRSVGQEIEIKISDSEDVLQELGGPWVFDEANYEGGVCYAAGTGQKIFYLQHILVHFYTKLGLVAQKIEKYDHSGEFVFGKDFNVIASGLVLNILRMIVFFGFTTEELIRFVKD